MRNLTLRNFKCFRDESLTFKSINMFAGANGAGKSTILQSLLLLRQSYSSSYLSSGRLLLNGEYVNIGRSQDLLFEGAESDTISITGVADEGTATTWVFDYERKSEVLSSPETVSRLDQNFFQDGLFAERFAYVSAERLGPRLFGAMSEQEVDFQRSIGSAGEFFIHYLAEFGDELVEGGGKLDSAPSDRLIDQTQGWLNSICPGVQLTIAPQAAIDIVALTFTFATPNGPSNAFRPTNVGFGLSYSLPVIVSALSARRGSCLLVENPEAHLHPAAQTAMGKLLAAVASGGVQVFVETHSEHVLNGLRLQVKNGTLPSEEVRIYFARRLSDNSESTLDEIMVNAHGQLDKWPSGFFDEYERELSILLERSS